MKISIPKPCHKNWENMTPESQGRFCKSCEKSVLDFTNWPSNDILNYFRKHSSERICGRFRNEQIQTIIIHIPKRELYLVPPAKYILLALFLAFGNILFSCTDNDGNKRKIDNIELVEETTDEYCSTTIGISFPPPITEIEFVPPVLTTETITAEFAMGDVETMPSDTGKSANKSTEFVEEVMWMGEPALPILQDENGIYDFADEMPEFPGGYDSLTAFIRRNISYKPLAGNIIGDKVYASFIVLKNGSLEEIKIQNAQNPEINEEMIRLFHVMPKWKPGKVNGQAVNIRLTIPVKFL